MNKKKNWVLSLSILLILMLNLGGGSTFVFADDTGPELKIEDEIDDLPSIQSASQERVEGSWWDCQVQYTTVINYLGYAEYGFGTWVGYWQNVELGHPRVGEQYLIKVAVYGVGSPASGQQAAVINFLLQSNTTIDTSGYPIRCFGGPDMLEFIDGCPQSLPFDNLNGTYNIPSGQYGNVWPIAPGAGWEFWIPVRTSTTLSSVNFTGVIDNIEAMNSPDKLFPTVPIYVFSESTQKPGAFNKVDPLDDAVNVPVDTFLEWQDSSNVTTYEYCIDTIDDNACLPWVDWSNPFNVLSPNTTYFWHIRAINDGGVTYSNGSPTAFWSFTTEDATSAPGAFGKYLPLNNATNVPTDLTLRWNESSGVSNYEYCYDTSNDGTCTTWVDVGLSTSNLLSGLATDTTYYWHVRAVNNVGTTYANGSESAFWSFKTEKSNSPPGAFSKASPADGATDMSTSPTLHWGTSSGAESYEYCIDDSDDNVCVNWIDVGAETSKALSGLDPNKTYYWHVRSRNEKGITYANGSETDFWSFKTMVLISADDGVLAIAVQGDGKILIGGYFEKVNDVTRNHIARLNPDGSLDTSFNPNINGRVDAIAIQPDGKILVGGYFQKIGTVTRNFIARLNENGSVDTAFDPNTNAAVYAILIQPDGKILVGGAFTSIDSTPRTRIARLTSNGTLDSSFKNIHLDNVVRTLAIQGDGKILIGGAFQNVDHDKPSFIARFHDDGHLDDTFLPVFNNNLMNLVIQPDGKILVGGQFTEVNGEGQKHITRLDLSGGIDQDFSASADDSIVSIALQADGKMILGGYFTKINGETHNHIVRLDPDGNVDNSLYLDANDLVTGVGLQSNGRILVGGLFTLTNGETHKYIARLLNNSPAEQELSLAQGSSGAAITWTLRNASPQVHRVTFELSTDGTHYTFLGNGDYVQGKWVLEELVLPMGQEIWIRARGYYDTGRFNGSGSVLEDGNTFKLDVNIFLPLVMR